LKPEVAKLAAVLAPEVAKPPVALEPEAAGLPEGTLKPEVAKRPEDLKPEVAELPEELKPEVAKLPAELATEVAKPPEGTLEAEVATRQPEDELEPEVAKLPETPKLPEIVQLLQPEATKLPEDGDMPEAKRPHGAAELQPPELFFIGDSGCTDLEDMFSFDMELRVGGPPPADAVLPGVTGLVVPEVIGQLEAEPGAALQPEVLQPPEVDDTGQCGCCEGSETRAKLVRRLFNLLGGSSGRLHEAGLFKFAKMTGFPGPAWRFRKEYVAMYRRFGVRIVDGIPLATFRQVVDLEVQGMVVCSGAVKAMVTELSKGRP
jgi:hypothetical protein